MTTSLAPKRDVRWAIAEAGPLLSLAASAEVAEVDRLTMLRIVREGILPTVSIGGGRVRVPRIALLRYLGIDTGGEDAA